MLQTTDMSVTDVFERPQARATFSPSAVALACRIRALELELLNLFKQGKLSGTVHTYVGQEMCAASVAGSFDSNEDAIFATHRGHGWYLAADGPIDAFLAELMGRAGGLCQGRGGSQHLHRPNFFSSGIQAGASLVATGWAFARKHQGHRSIAIAQIGDGTLGEGALYEALTFAALLKSPVLFLLEWNGCAQSTDVRTTTPGDIIKRVEGFGIKVDRRSDADPSLPEHMADVVRLVREGQPFFQIIDTRRLMPHSKGDDHRSVVDLEALRQADPLTTLIDADPDARRLFADAQREMSDAADRVSSLPLIEPDTQSAWPDSRRSLSSDQLRHDATITVPTKVVDELNRSLHRVMESNRRVFMIGEDVLDPYGGAFKVSRGLSTRFPDRVFSTPIAEAAIVGVSNGMALAGLRPVAEIMFADFVTLATDQIVNHSAKFHHMYAGQVTCPVVVRIPSGGRRGYGPTHSQSTESLFLGVPGLRVIACSKHHSIDRLVDQLTSFELSPTILVENKLLYAGETPAPAPLELTHVPTLRENGDYPPLWFRPSSGRAPDVTLVTYGGMVDICEAAMRQLIFDDEISFEFIVLTQLWPLTSDEVVTAVSQSKRLVVAEEGVATYGVSAAVIAAVAQQLQSPVNARAVGMRPVPIPCAKHLEEAVLPSVAELVRAIRSVIR